MKRAKRSPATTALVALLLSLLFASGLVSDEGNLSDPAAYEQDAGTKIDSPSQVVAPHWGVLHADQQRTDSLSVRGVRSNPVIFFDKRDTDLAAFSGTMVGPQNETSLGIGGKLYRCLGPGPISFHPPEGIPLVIGTTSAVEVRHPRTGEILGRRKFNLGLFTNFPSVDDQGFVYVPDWARLHKFTPGMTEIAWVREFENSILRDRLAMVPAGSIGFLPDGNVLVCFLGGLFHVLDKDTGRTLNTFDLNRLDPPVRPDPQFGFLKIVFRNAIVIEGDELFVLVSGEIIRLVYEEKDHSLRVVERTKHPGFSSSTPTLDIKRRRLFLVTYDPDDPDRAPSLMCYDTSSVPMKLRWSIETDIGFFESEDQLTATYLPSSGVILNNSLYGHVTAYREVETESGPLARRLWSTAETVSERFAAYIATASDLDNTVYVTDNLVPRLYALDALTGSVLWSLDLPDRSIKKPVLAPGVVYLDHHRGILAIVQGTENSGR